VNSRRVLSLAALVALAGTAPAVVGPAAAARQRQAVTYAIGYEGPLSGAYAQFGISELDGVRLAVAQANARGNLAFSLRLRASDDQGDPVHAPAAATLLTTDPAVKGVVGPAYSGATQAVGHIYQNAHLGFVSPSATVPDLSRQGWRVFHRVVPSDTVEGMFGADWLSRKGVHRMYVVRDTSVYGVTLGNAVTHEARAKGIQVTYVQSAATTTTGFRTLAQHIAASGARAVFYAGFDAEAGHLAKALANAGYSGLRLSGNGIFDSLFTTTAGPAGNGYYAVCGCMTKFGTQAQQAFASAFRARFHHAPTLFAAQAYDAANAIVRALSAAVALGHTGRAAVNAALGAVNFAGISTRVKFAANGDVARSAARVNLFQDRHGTFVQLGDVRNLP
jgi:branched-chain amino acid transport system substrate-binding protein